MTPTLSKVLKQNSYPGLFQIPILLGGGSAFESGGPGKGLYCLFYADVLASLDGQRFSHFKSFYKEFQDSGIFGIYGMGPQDSIRPGIRIAIEQLKRIANVSLIFL